jgi:hypothetical protein
VSAVASCAVATGAPIIARELRDRSDAAAAVDVAIEAPRERAASS